MGVRHSMAWSRLPPLRFNNVVLPAAVVLRGVALCRVAERLSKTWEVISMEAVRVQQVVAKDGEVLVRGIPYKKGQTRRARLLKSSCYLNPSTSSGHRL